MDTPLLIDAYEAGRLLSMPSARVKRLAKQGMLPSVLLPDGEPRFMREALAAWAKQHSHPAAAEGHADG